MSTRTFAAFGALAAFTASFAIASSPSAAENWPDRNVRIITSFPAGAGGDISARLYAERLALRWGKPVIVENKPGADVSIAVSIPASLKIASLTEFVAFARSQPGKLNWGATSGALDYVIPGFLKGAGLD